MQLPGRPVQRLILIIIIIITGLYITGPQLLMFTVPPHIRNLLWIVFIISGLLLLFIYLTAPRPPFAGPPPPGGQPGLAPESITIKGYVRDYSSNPYGDIDKILVEQKDERYMLHFPPHAAKQVLQLAEKNTLVQAVAMQREGKGHHPPPLELLSIHSDSLGRTIDLREIPPPPPVRGTETILKGNSIQIQTDKEGRVTGFLLDNKFVVLKPPVVQNLLPLLQHASQIVVRGNERGTQDGFVHITGLPVVHPDTITIDGVNYMLP